MQCFIFGEVLPLSGHKKEEAANPTKVGFGKNGTRSPYFKVKKLESQDLDHNFKDVTRVSKKNLLCSMTCSQIRQSPLLDDLNKIHLPDKFGKKTLVQWFVLGN
jgi:hypothetical protein